MLVALTFALTPNQHLRSPAICEFAEGCGWEACWGPYDWCLLRGTQTVAPPLRHRPCSSTCCWPTFRDRVRAGRPVLRRPLPVRRHSTPADAFGRPGAGLACLCATHQCAIGPLGVFAVPAVSIAAAIDPAGPPPAGRRWRPARRSGHERVASCSRRGETTRSPQCIRQLT